MRILLSLLVVFALVGLYAYWRLRPYIRMARKVFGAARDAGRVSEQQQQQEPADQPRRAQSRAGEKLVRCASCGTWLPASSALSIGKAGTHFCSHECLERSADDSQRTRRSAS